MARVVIIGAGLTGLSTAYHLERAGFSDYVLLEREGEVGGLCRSWYQDGFTFDYTGHLLHLNDAYARDLIFSLYPEDNFAHLNRRSSIFSQGVSTKYPFQINLHGLPPAVIVDCIESFVMRPALAAQPKTFRQWVIHNFGEGLGKYFFFPYQQKIFDVAIDELSASWTSRFVPATSLREMLLGALSGETAEVGYNAQFLYPLQGGIVRWVQALHDRLQAPARIHHGVTSIDGAQRIVRCSNGYESSFEYLVSTMPLDMLLQSLVETSATHMRPALKHLRCNRVINFNLGISKESLADDHWRYYPEPHYPFYRIGFPSNLTDTMAPQGYSSLSGECSFLQRSESEIVLKTEEAIAATCSLFGLSAHDIVTQAIMSIPHAYVIFDAWRDEHLPTLLHQLAVVYHIYSCGRYGGWKYSSMQDALLEGREIAALIIKSIR